MRNHPKVEAAELLPCPFCEETYPKVRSMRGDYWVTCRLCNASTRMRISKQGAVEDWNTRATPKPLEGQAARSLEWWINTINERCGDHAKMMQHCLCSAVNESAAQLQQENDQLRELVRQIWCHGLLDGHACTAMRLEAQEFIAVGMEKAKYAALGSKSSGV